MELILYQKSGKSMILLLITLAFIILIIRYFQIYRSPSDVRSFIGFSAEKLELVHSDQGGFSVITYNVAGLPQVICSATTERAKSMSEIGTLLNDYDIAHVQEDFNYNRFLYQGGNQHPYRTKTKGGIPFGDGLNTLSKFPILEMRRIPWRNCNGADCLTPKGFTYSKIEIAKDIYIDFYNVHANAADDPASAAARRKNIEQLSRYIQDHSADQAVIVMGDINAHFCYEHDNIRDFIHDNQLSDTWLMLKANDCFPMFKPFVKEDILLLSDECESIDKVLYRSSHNLLLTPSQYRFENLKFRNNQEEPLSDHCPVSVYFSWKYI